MEQKVIYNGQVLTLTRFWATGEPCLWITDPVSYTHLDVYKRQIIACDPLVELEDTLPFMQTLPAGNYAVKICVVPSEKYGDRYACVKVEVSQEKPVRYEPVSYTHLI